MYRLAVRGKRRMRTVCWQASRVWSFDDEVDSVSKEDRGDRMLDRRLVRAKVRCVAGGALCRCFRDLTSTHLFGFEVLVEEIERFLVRTWTASDCEHALAGFVVRGFGDRNTRSG